MRYDVIVLGGGFAGVAAAIAAAREGADTLLVEKGNGLGGAAANCLVNPFMPNGTKIDGQFTELSQGLYLTIRDELNRFADRYQPDRGYKGKETIHEEYLKLILNRMTAREGVHLLFHAYLSGVNMDNGRITSITVSAGADTRTIEGDMFIDATGDMTLGVMSGCGWVLGRPADNICQPMTLCFRLGNIDLDTYAKVRPEINRLYCQFQAEGRIKNPRENVLIFHTVNEGVLHFNTTRIVKRSPVDMDDLTAAEIDAREQVFEMYDFLRENIDGFQNATLLSTAAEIGIRESRMLKGRYVLTQEDLVQCKKFDDSIALGNYDIDIHNPEGTGTSHYYFPEGQYYSVPYRTMLPLETENLLVTGRCISATHEAQASIRIMPIVCCLGEAAGIAAALAASERTTPAAVNVKKLQELLAAHGGKF